MNTSTNPQTYLPADSVTLFSLGSVVATPGALDLLDRTGMNATNYLVRHQQGDFGSLSSCDIQENLLAVQKCRRILSAYDVGDECLWVLTEANRAVTTLLLPSEY